MRNQFYLFVILTSLVFFSMKSFGQIAPDGGPLDIEADSLRVIDLENQAIYAGNVDVRQANVRLRTEKLTLIFAEERNPETDALNSQFGEVKELIAEDEIYYITPQQKARGDMGVYDHQAGTITITGNVVLTSCENVIRGDRLVINVRDGYMDIRANSTKRGERVRTLIIPNSNNSDNPECQT